jgi:hypothetical protein
MVLHAHGERCLNSHRETDRFLTASGIQLGHYQWTLPLPPCAVLLTAQRQSGQHPRQDCRFTYQLKGTVGETTP